MSTTDNNPVVMVIDDNQDHLDLMAKTLKSGIARGEISLDEPILTFDDPVEAIAELPANRQVVVLLDYHLKDGTALDWLIELVKHDPGPVIVITSQGDEQIAAQTLKSGASDYLAKDQVMTNPSLLYSAIRQALRRYRLDQRNRGLAKELKINNQSLERQNVKQKALTETAHRFVADVAHEFRTPLAAIQEFASIINDGIGGPVTDQQKEFLGYIMSGTSDLAQLVDDFLDSSRLKHRMLRVDRKPRRVEELFDLVRRTILTKAQGKKITLQEQIQPGLSDVFCDLEKAGRALVNLAVNAVKFSPEGSTVRLSAQESDQGEVQVDVSDRGQGIPEEEIARISQRFGQALNASAGTIKGFGLGLNIAKDLVELNLGRMTIKSRVGEGSTFSFTLPGCDPHHLLNRYLMLMAARDDSVALTVLLATQSTPEAEAGKLRGFISSICYPMDLVMSSFDRRSVLLIGATTEPDIWMTRLHSEWESRAASRERPDSLNVRWVGTWSRPELDLALEQCVMDHLLEVRASA